MEDNNYNKNNNNNSNIIDDYASNIITTNINNYCLFSSSSASTSTSPPSTPSATANDTAGSRLYRARLILENHLYDELLSRYKLAITRLRELSREATTLREENELLRLSNTDLVHRLNQVLAAPEQPYTSPGSGGGWSTNDDHHLNNSTVFGGGNNNNNNNNSNMVNNEVIGSNNSPTSTVINEEDDDDEEEEGDERVSMPKSISVRSPGYFKLLNLPNTVIQSRKSPSHHQSHVNGAILRVKREEKALEMDVFNQGMYKTELCNKWQETGTCPYGQQCQFAHGLSELRPVIRHPRYKTQVCRMVLAGVTCPYGHRCHFRHSLS